MAPDTIIETLQLYNKVGGPRYSGDSILQMMVLGSSLDDIAAHLRRNPANYFRKWR
jgi:predicted amidohydrolase